MITTVGLVRSHFKQGVTKTLEKSQGVTQVAHMTIWFIQKLAIMLRHPSQN